MTVKMEDLTWLLAPGLDGYVPPAATLRVNYLNDTLDLCYGDQRYLIASRREFDDKSYKALFRPRVEEIAEKIAIIEGNGG